MVTKPIDGSLSLSNLRRTGFGAQIANIQFQGERRMKTGQDVIEAGLYVTECCGEEVELRKDATFPRCLRCMSLTRWELVELPSQQAA